MRALAAAALVAALSGTGLTSRSPTLTQASYAQDGPPDLAGTGPTNPTGKLAGMHVMKEREARGEPCAVCGGALGEGERAVQVRGRWVPLHDGACWREFEADPAAAFSAMQPRGALFDEPSRAPSPLRWIWFFAGGYVLAGLVCAGLAAHLSYPRGRNPLFWFGMGLAANVAAVAILMLSAPAERPVPGRMAKLHVTPDPAPCPSCGAPNHPAARRCLSCGAAIAAGVDSEAFRAARGGGPAR